MKIGILKSQDFEYFNSENKIEFKSNIENYIAVVYDKNNNFLARGVLCKIDENLYSTSGTVARSGYGKLLYETLAMIAYDNDSYICMEREGGSPNEKVWKIYNDLYNKENIQKIELKEDYLEFFDMSNKEKNPVPFYAYNLKPTKNFKNSLVSNKRIIEKLVNESKSYFDRAYTVEDMSNSWINKELPIIKRNKKNKPK